MSDEYPTNIDDYDLLEEVHRSKYSRLMRAFCRPRQEIVCIRVFDLERFSLLGFADALSAIRREVQVFKTCRHPNLTDYHTCFVEASKLYLVTEYLTGNLTMILEFLRDPTPTNLPPLPDPDSSTSPTEDENGRVSLASMAASSTVFSLPECRLPQITDEALIFAILYQILLGIQSCHQNNLIHRTLKGSSLLCSRTGYVKLSGFHGCGFLVNFRGDQKRRLTFTTEMNVSWTAPEVLEQVSGYGAKIDIWSFGITALELIEGKVPYHGLEPLKVYTQVIQFPPPKLTSLFSFSDELRSVIATCLTKSPTERPDVDQVLAMPFFQNKPTVTMRKINALSGEVMKEEVVLLGGEECAAYLEQELCLGKLPSQTERGQLLAKRNGVKKQKGKGEMGEVGRGLLEGGRERGRGGGGMTERGGSHGSEGGRSPEPHGWDFTKKGEEEEEGEKDVVDEGPVSADAGAGADAGVAESSPPTPPPPLQIPAPTPTTPPPATAASALGTATPSSPASAPATATAAVASPTSSSSAEPEPESSSTDSKPTTYEKSEVLLLHLLRDHTSTFKSAQFDPETSRVLFDIDRQDARKLGLSFHFFPILDGQTCICTKEKKRIVDLSSGEGLQPDEPPLLDPSQHGLLGDWVVTVGRCRANGVGYATWYVGDLEDDQVELAIDVSRILGRIRKLQSDADQKETYEIRFVLVLLSKKDDDEKWSLSEAVSLGDHVFSASGEKFMTPATPATPRTSRIRESSETEGEEGLVLLLKTADDALHPIVYVDQSEDVHLSPDTVVDDEDQSDSSSTSSFTPRSTPEKITPETSPAHSTGSRSLRSLPDDEILSSRSLNRHDRQVRLGRVKTELAAMRQVMAGMMKKMESMSEEIEMLMSEESADSDSDPVTEL